MSHDRGCPCGRERWDYEYCTEGDDCFKKERVARWKAEDHENLKTEEEPLSEVDHYTDAELEKALTDLAALDVQGLMKAREAYGDSWKAEGGFSAFFNIKRKIDRLVTMIKRDPVIINRSRSGLPNLQRERYDIFSSIMADVAEGGEGTLDAVRDLRRYLLLVESELVLRGEELPVQRDNAHAQFDEAVVPLGGDSVTD